MPEKAEHTVSCISIFATPLGNLWAGFSDRALVTLSFKPSPPSSVSTKSSHPLEQPLRLWLEDYFFKRFHPPTLPLAPCGTPFQHRVWSEVAKINAGNHQTYGQLATQLGTAPRAVGQAMAANPVLLLIPCHRIIATNHKIGGYSGGEGTNTKRWLLHWEGAELP
ncbi:MAG: methylated-DNA--protein-cysteine methyltransferase [Magnetococcales bacterium]|nr:methylated-DNA--protein-cysteine methyltransferase [Magnetococcales bacterium]HIJ86041.1 methylated-DNA--[protein]-cysteine S-methyltransferase [Magnetococcales bacterium]